LPGLAEPGRLEPEQLRVGQRHPLPLPAGKLHPAVVAAGQHGLGAGRQGLERAERTGPPDGVAESGNIVEMLGRPQANVLAKLSG
jgi:hypothetical protein